MKTSILKSSALFTLFLVLGVTTSCEKNDKLEAPEEINSVIDARSEDKRWALNLDSADVLGNYLPEMLAPEGVYLNKVFGKLNPTQVIQYGSDASDQVEFFSAQGNYLRNRPMVIIAPGGAWKNHTEVPKLRLFAADLAKRGYAVGIVKYYVNATEPQPSFETQLKSVQEIRSVVRYFKLHSTQFNVDPNNIFIGGWSTGATSALAAAYIQDDKELNEISEQPIRDGFLNAVNNEGFDNTDNTGANSKVRGVIAMFAYMLQETFIDAGEAPLMMINHKEAHFANGTRIIGTLSYNGATIYGTDALYNRATAENFVVGQNLNYIRMQGASPYKGYNEAALSENHYNNIASFLYGNMKK